LPLRVAITHEIYWQSLDLPKDLELTHRCQLELLLLVAQRMIRRLLSPFPACVLALLVLVASPASADNIINFDTCFPGTWVCNPLVGGALSFALDSGAVKARVFGTYRGDNAFGFNISGPTEGLTISIVTAGYSLGGNDQIIGPLGSFEYVLDGPPPVSTNCDDALPFRFQLDQERWVLLAI
jgi:hypothetical protein